ncbi:hypothetical protein WIS52_19105 [Pseudonocardia nematodicida]|uniref:Uncharacterized protein n=1 Tax=Pseudonocardia nematodicida TaxID=1206997 RepID=A0ABV1KDP5_9PSEU
MPAAISDPLDIADGYTERDAQIFHALAADWESAGPVEVDGWGIVEGEEPPF